MQQRSEGWMDKKEARKILKVTKDTSRNEIERKFSIYLKRHRMEQAKAAEDQEAADGQDEEILQDSAVEPIQAKQPEGYSFEQITKAYDVLMGYEVPEKIEAPGKAAPLLKKAGIDEKKAKNFFYYYKYHMLAIIAVIIITVFTVRGCVKNVKPDFSLAFIGRFIYSDAVDDIKGSIKANVPVIVEPGIDGAYLADDSMGEQQYAMEMKATVLFAAGDLDVIILDKATFARYAKQGALMSLDEIAPRLGVDLNANQEFVVGIEEDDGAVEIEGMPKDEAMDDAAQAPSEVHLFGIDISDSKSLKQAGVVSNEMVATIFVGCEQVEKAEKLLQFLLEK